ncbi:MAG: 3-isopropylmalate dehydratase large subunit [Bacteroidales bacterium]|jgi:homoaconitate hydratase family protein/3-isopropylmalate dehydratase small subunit|nr:3-isopropylmalate dehydratase large subunit [Bacteroidales bacterium]
MGLTFIEKIISQHSGNKNIKPDDIVDVAIDCRAARDFGGANVVKNLIDHALEIEDPSKTYFTFDCNPGGSDQKYAQNQQYCRMYARETGITIFDVDKGIGTHNAIENGLAFPGSTVGSTDSHANIMGAIGCFGQGMGDQDIAAAWAAGSVWFKVPHSVKINFLGKKAQNITAKDIVLNLLHRFGANSLLGCAVELYGETIEHLTLDERITIASMATEMGAIILFFTPNNAIIEELKQLTGKVYSIISADEDAQYSQEFEVNISEFVPMVARPGHPHDDIAIAEVLGTKIDSAFVGSCTNGRIKDLRVVAQIVKGKKVAPGVVFKIVPATDSVWKQALEEGLLKIFKDAGALISNAGCAGCAAGQLGQNGQDEVTLSTGNRNFAGKQGKGWVYLASPAVVAASAIAGCIATPDNIPTKATEFTKTDKFKNIANLENAIPKIEQPTVVEGNVWLIERDDIDTDMIFHNRYLTITELEAMGQYAFDNLAGYEDFAQKAIAGDIMITGKNFGAGSSRQQAVDCFIALKISAILARSYGAIYERNAINAAMPVLTYFPENLVEADVENGDRIRVDFITGVLTNITKNKSSKITPFYEAQLVIYNKGGLLK